MQTLQRTRSALWYLKGRYFRQQGDQWVDAKTDQMPQARRVRIRFDSRDYFELLDKHRDHVPCLTGARNLLVAVGDTIYDIHE